MTLPATMYLDRLPNTKFDLVKLIEEYKSVDDLLDDVTNHNNATLVQRKFHLTLKGVVHPRLAELPYTDSVIQEIFALEKFNSVTYRAIRPNTCYNWHVDQGKTCVHIPLITAVGALFIYENRNFYMPADGSAYIVNNGIPHTFANAGHDDRVHLTFENL
jgi:hypothetical protein